MRDARRRTCFSSIARRPFPFVCTSPPVDGQPADALLFWGGDDAAADGNGVTFVARTEAAEGITVKVALGGHTAARCTGNERCLAFENVFELGQNWCYVVVPAGETRVAVRT